ncbi:hypothetical protein HWV23_00950 [Natronomonas halophila]|uniref:hypothetical protein n=1 Tax=Natronomonas halophila TaxID=2747817 RepID=UPI0015B60BB1|nr:hypothetical protein [Natronomonas halophila]QLD84332.1 hypothetical protein HWV23_00950 [Natronomonas halophila]
MSGVSDRIETLAERARRDRETFEPPPDPPDEEAAMRYLTEGVGDVVALYIEARTGERVRFDDAEFVLLERALNDWFELYAACYGSDLDAAFTVREVAELVVETHSIREAALLLTRIPERDQRESWRHPDD